MQMWAYLKVFWVVLCHPLHNLAHCLLWGLWRVWNQSASVRPSCSKSIDFTHNAVMLLLEQFLELWFRGPAQLAPGAT